MFVNARAKLHIGIYDDDDDETPKYSQCCPVQKIHRIGKKPSDDNRLVDSTTSTIIGRSLPEVSMVSVQSLGMEIQAQAIAHPVISRLGIL